LSTWFLKSAPPVVSGVQRLPPPLTPKPDATIDAAIERSQWTQYADYSTVRIGRIERPARLLTGRTQWVRELNVPAAGARFEAFVGTVDGAATVRVGRPDTTAVFETHTAAGEWTRVAVDLDAHAGSRQSLTIDVDVPPGAVAAWGSELVIPYETNSKPDVILISLDTVRRDQLTPYVPSLPTTPNLAAFARDALVFDQAISTSSWTVASHSTLFTGHFPADSLGYHSRVEPAEYTLPEIFGANGYRTFGLSGGPFTEPRWGLHQGFDEYVTSGKRENARDATSRAIDWMANAGPVPVFLFLNLFDAHEPLELSPEVRQLTGVTEDVPTPIWYELDAGRRPVTDALRQRIVRAYGAELTSIDEELRRLFAYLRQEGRWDRTLVIVWADHGQLLGERNQVGHAYALDEELIRIPLIIKASASIPLPLGVYRSPIQGDDLFGLSQSLAGLPSADGAEVLADLNANAPIRQFAFSKIHHDPLPTLTSHFRWRSATQWSVRDGSTKIIRDLEGRAQAYDLSGPEERPIPIGAAHQSLVTALQQFRVWSEQARARTLGPLSPAEVERLRSLGYIQ
jgi:arylsulfatase A-like enzyme